MGAQVKELAVAAWLIFYGHSLPPDALNGVGLAVLDPDQMVPDRRAYSNVRFIGYLSVGEAENYRGYWAQVAGKDFIVGENPDWPGSYRLDIRSRAWQKLLLDQIVPSILKKGYDGLFLDTVDTATWLEEKDPKRYRGAKAALVQFVRTLRRKFPSIAIYSNNGLEFLADYGREIDGVFVEDLYTRYDFAAKKTGPTPKNDTEAKELLLDKFRSATGKPVMTILYETSPNTPLAQYAIARSRAKGYLWYLTDVGLMRVGTVGK